MLFPDSVTIIDQIVNFSIPTVIIFKLSVDKVLFYTYPLTRIYPLRAYKFSSKLPKDWMALIKKTNEVVSKDILKDWDRIEKSSPQGVILWYENDKYYLPFTTFDVKEFPQSNITLSLNFISNSDFREFEFDRLVAVKMIQIIIFLNKCKTVWRCEVNAEKFKEIYDNIVSFTDTNILSNDNVMYVLDEDMKKRMEYLKNVDSVTSIQNSRIMLEKQINESQIYTSRKLSEIEPSLIKTHLLVEKDHQYVTIDCNVYILKKHASELSAREWLSDTRLQALNKIVYSRNDMKAYPNTKYQFFISIYENLSDYLKELIEDVDGYKVSIIKHQKSFYVIIPIFIPYRPRLLNGDSNKNYIGMIKKNSYWTLENELFINEIKIDFPFKIEISSVVNNIHHVSVLTSDGLVWLVDKSNNPICIDVEPILKITSGYDHICLLSKLHNLFVFTTNNLTKIDCNVTNVWSFKKSSVYIKNNILTLWGEKTSLPLTIENWKTITPGFGLTYQGKVIDLEKNKELKFRKPIIQISENKGTLFTLTKKSYFVVKNEIVEEKKEAIKQIIDPNLKLR